VSPLVFLLLAALTVAAALTVVLHRNAVHSACALGLTLFLVFVFFIGLDAQLVAMLQLVVYAGAIVILFLFVIMLLNPQAETRPLGGPALRVAAAAGGLALVAFVVVALGRAGAPRAHDVPAGFGETETLARSLFTSYLFPFELTSVLLLVAIVGAVALARKETEQ
jgi:NADH-quinone oxidoreductase subunit J